MAILDVTAPPRAHNSTRAAAHIAPSQVFPTLQARLAYDISRTHPPYPLRASSSPAEVAETMRDTITHLQALAIDFDAYVHGVVAVLEQHGRASPGLADQVRGLFQSVIDLEVTPLLRRAADRLISER
jgi:hypothetical protein